MYLQEVLMKKNQLERMFEGLLAQAGIQLNGAQPWDIRMHRPRAIEQIFAQANLGLGETYMRGDWDCAALDEFFFRILRSQLHHQIRPLRLAWHVLRFKLFNQQTHRRAWRVGQHHYDLGNAFYQAMLGDSMAYTCAYWANAENLEQAQQHKLELICQKLQLKPGMRLLDIGCGWGSLMAYAAQHYQVECVGVTISQQQVSLGRQRCAGLPVEFRLQDYRQLHEPFDAIASVGMFEHVGRKNMLSFMQVAQRCLKQDGLFLLHTIGKNITHSAPDPWIDRYIFPNGDLPSLQQISRAVEGRFVVEDLHNFGADYDRTLMAWFANFEQHWPLFVEQYGERFYRMWKYYLLSCAGAFRARDLQLWQWLMSKRGVVGGYRRPLL
jgi:cyclopropane-fatty-acyl-phospholipid synthase